MCKTLTAALLAAVVLAGCGPSPDDEDVKFWFDRGEACYKARQFGNAISMYMRAIERYPDYYQAWIGMGHACLMRGNELYGAVDQLSQQNKPTAAGNMLEDARSKHDEALRCFSYALELRPDDAQPRFGLGKLCFDRALSPYNYPFNLNDTVSRQKELNHAIDELEKVVEMVPQSWFSHRYLGLAYLWSDRIDEGRKEILIYHDALQRLYEEWRQKLPGRTDEERKERQESLRELEKDIDEVHQTLVMLHEELSKERMRLRSRGPGNLTKEEEERLVRVSREELVLAALLKKFSEERLDPDAQALKDRCAQYLRRFNAGKYAECMGFLRPYPGQEEDLRRRLAGLIERGVRYEEIDYKNIVIDKGLGSVGFVCRRVTKDRVQDSFKVTVQWRRVEEAWYVSGLP